MSIKKVGTLSTLFFGLAAAVAGGMTTYELNTPETYQARYQSLSAQEAEYMRKDSAFDFAESVMTLTTGILVGALVQRMKLTA